VPSFFVLVPGPWTDASSLVDSLRAQGIDARPRGAAPAAEGVAVDIIADGDLGPGFLWGPDGAASDGFVRVVGDCRHAALIEVGGLLHVVAPRLALLGRALRAQGGVGVRMEASGAASEWDPWLARLESGEPRQIYTAGVTLVGGDDGFFTCGMHQFDRPDAEIAMADAHGAARWLNALCCFQLEEDPALGAGHTFRPDARHHPDDGRHNPFGVWRLLPEGGERLPAQDPVPTIMPPLIALLVATENRLGRALTRAEVDALVNEAPAMAISQRHAMALERARGYADLEPRLAWDQWQIVRRASKRA
jgi:hypothetical protein